MNQSDPNASQSLQHFFQCHLDVSEAALSPVTALFKPLNLDKKVLVLSSGTQWQHAYFIEQGLLRLYYNTEDGKEFNKGFFAEGELIWPMVPSAQQAPSLFTIATLEPTRLWKAPFSAMVSAIEGIDSWSHFALNQLEKLADQKFLREYQWLTFDAATRLQCLREEMGELVDRIPDYHLASYLGITSVALSRIKNQHRKDQA